MLTFNREPAFPHQTRLSKEDVIDGRSFNATPSNAPISTFRLTSNGTLIHIVSFKTALLNIAIPSHRNAPTSIILKFNSLKKCLSGPTYCNTAVKPSTGHASNNRIAVNNIECRLPRGSKPSGHGGLRASLSRNLRGHI